MLDSIDEQDIIYCYEHGMNKIPKCCEANVYYFVGNFIVLRKLEGVRLIKKYIFHFIFTLYTCRLLKE